MSIARMLRFFVNLGLGLVFYGLLLKCSAMSLFERSRFQVTVLGADSHGTAAADLLQRAAYPALSDCHRSGQVRSGQVRSGQVRFIIRPKSRTMSHKAAYAAWSCQRPGLARLGSAASGRPSTGLSTGLTQWTRLGRWPNPRAQNGA